LINHLVFEGGVHQDLNVSVYRRTRKKRRFLG
jgi:hypothetical protein